MSTVCGLGAVSTVRHRSEEVGEASSPSPSGSTSSVDRVDQSEAPVTRVCRTPSR